MSVGTVWDTLQDETWGILYEEKEEEENPTMKPPLAEAQDTIGEVLSWMTTPRRKAEMPKYP